MIVEITLGESILFGFELSLEELLFFGFAGFYIIWVIAFFREEQENKKIQEAITIYKRNYNNGS